MADPIILTVPDDISARARQIAEMKAQPVENVLLDHLRTLSAPLPALPPDVQAEIDALKHLSDDALWTIYVWLAGIVTPVNIKLLSCLILKLERGLDFTTHARKPGLTILNG